jgi:hypothetical protein
LDPSHEVEYQPCGQDLDFGYAAEITDTRNNMGPEKKAVLNR